MLNSLITGLAMGSYGAYVWSGVGITIAVLVGFHVNSTHRYRNIQQNLTKQIERETRAEMMKRANK